jgi:hypothetical protein
MNLPHSARRGPWAIIAALSLAPTLARAQYDQGTLVIRSGDREIGSEEFRVRVGPDGFRISGRATFLGRPGTSLTASLDRETSGDFAFQLDRRVAGGGAQVYAVQKRNRLTIRRVERGAEQASEVPGGPSIVVLADSVFSLYAQVALLTADSGRAFTLVFPGGPRQVKVTVQRAAGPGATVRISGGMNAAIELGNRGQLLRISLPTLGLEAVRKEP